MEHQHTKMEQENGQRKQMQEPKKYFHILNNMEEYPFNFGLTERFVGEKNWQLLEDFRKEIVSLALSATNCKFNTSDIKVMLSNTKDG